MINPGRHVFSVFCNRDWVGRVRVCRGVCTAEDTDGRREGGEMTFWMQVAKGVWEGIARWSVCVGTLHDTFVTFCFFFVMSVE